MNTDNMSILGLTIVITARTVGSTTTIRTGRRTRRTQRVVAIASVISRTSRSGTSCDSGEALIDAEVPDEKPLEDGLSAFARTFDREHATMTAQKLGWRTLREEDDALLGELFSLMRQTEVDLTIFFRGLSDVSLESPSLVPLEDAFYDAEEAQGYRDARLRALAREVGSAHEDRGRARSSRGDERGQPALRAAQLPRAAGHRRGRAW